ncbi:MAG TPA: YbaL family putative K(+) efflux transporter [Rhizomicrobium sp.]|nr:YbaL family putative K(+) efflux transporter [Rhizomicrobium sp.]
MSPLIGVLVIGLSLAFVLGTIAQRLKLPPLVGYLLAGVVVGPFSPGITLDQHITLQLADIGVVLLMFGVGLHFKPGELMAVKATVVPGAILQMAVITALGVGASLVLGWPWAQGLVFGLCLSVASTVVVMRALQDRRLTETGRGRIAIGWLVVQDLLTVLVLVLMPPIADLLKGGDVHVAVLARSLGITFGKLALFAGLMLVIGRRVIPAILHYIAHTGSRELFRLAVLSVALGVAFAASYVFGVSIALGAFFAGMILAGSQLSQRAAEESLPLRDAFAVLFFVSVGMLFDPRVVVDRPLDLTLTFGIVLAGGGVCYVLLRLFGVQSASALTIAVSLTQIGEFSFILADLDIGLGVLPEEARGLILGASILSIFLNPLLFALAARREASPNIAPAPDMPKPAPERTKLTDHAVVVGYGRVGHLIADGIRNSFPLLVVEEGAVGDPGIEHIRGNAARDDVLAAANLPAAKLLFVAIPEAFEAGQIVQQARRANPALPIVARAHFDAEVDHLLSLGASQVIMGEREIALAMLDFAKNHQPAAG